MFAEVNGVTLYYEVFGAGPPLLMLHGNGESGEIFRPAAEALAKTFTVYRLDSRGHGRSGPGVLSYRAMAEDAAEFIRGVVQAPCLLYGFSDGGIIALIAAAAHPEAVLRLAVSGANTRPRGLKLRWRVLMALGYLFTRDEKLRLMLREPDISPDELARITMPTLVTAGSRDMIKTLHTKRLAQAVPGARLVILPGETHGSYVARGETLAPILTGFFADTEKELGKRKDKAGCSV